MSLRHRQLRDASHSLPRCLNRAQIRKNGHMYRRMPHQPTPKLEIDKWIGDLLRGRLRSNQCDDTLGLGSSGESPRRAAPNIQDPRNTVAILSGPLSWAAKVTWEPIVSRIGRPGHGTAATHQTWQRWPHQPRPVA